MDLAEVLDALKSLGNAGYAELMRRNHGVTRPIFGVKIGAMKPLVKKIGRDYQLALDLYDTGVYDAMYLAGLIADDARMTESDLQHWAEQASGGSLVEATVPWVAAQGRFGWRKGLQWIEDQRTTVARVGWATLACVVALQDDADLDLQALKTLLERVEKAIHKAPDALPYTMNNFLISVGCYVKPLSGQCVEIGRRIGTVHAWLGPNQCKIPFAPDYIDKVARRGTLGKKRRTVKC